MGTADSQGGGGRKPDPVEAFSAILKDMDLVRPLNYRHSTFRKWKQVVEMALKMYLGGEDPRTQEFIAIEFSGPFPRSPMDPPVTEKDKQAYTDGMDRTKEMLEAVLVEVRGKKEEAAEAASASASAVLTAASAGFRLARVAIPLKEAPPPGGKIKPDASVDLPRHEGIPTGGLKIVSRAGGGIATSLEDYSRSIEDPHEKELVDALQTIIDNPEATWNDVRNILAELWWYRRESLQKIIPVILKR